MRKTTSRDEVRILVWKKYLPILINTSEIHILICFKLRKFS